MDKKNLFTFRNIILGCGIALACGCIFGDITHVKSLARALKSEGLNYKTEQIPDSKGRSCPQLKIEEEVILQGDDVVLLVNKLGQKATLEELKTKLGYALAMIEINLVPGSVKALFKEPFIVIVVKEPADGVTRNALAKIFPGSEIEEIKASPEGYDTVRKIQSEMKTLFGH